MLFSYTVPTTSPANINVDCSSTQCTVTWSAVTGGSAGEEVTGYNLCLIEGSEEDCTQVSADILSYTFDLNPETGYSIRISAVNANGEGPSSGGSFTTGNYIELSLALNTTLMNIYSILFSLVRICYRCEQATKL